MVGLDRDRPGQGVHRPGVRHATAELADTAQPGGPLYGIAVSNDGRVIVFPGGIPLKQGDEVIGAVGVSGGQIDQDQAVAEAGAGALK
jgi:uncharacterized protein GlcG (DUF336 family)